MLHEHVLPMLLGELVLDLGLELGLEPRMLEVFFHDH